MGHTHFLSAIFPIILDSLKNFQGASISNMNTVLELCFVANITDCQVLCDNTAWTPSSDFKHLITFLNKYALNAGSRSSGTTSQVSGFNIIYSAAETLA